VVGCCSSSLFSSPGPTSIKEEDAFLLSFRRQGIATRKKVLLKSEGEEAPTHPEGCEEAAWSVQGKMMIQ
uniref:Uncharacterized protein n=1 Tax=Aegilops tauschii subsp. strangulata TaxID=200361 RepID=A0A453GEB5_AEGTS